MFRNKNINSRSAEEREALRKRENVALSIVSLLERCNYRSYSPTLPTISFTGLFVPGEIKRTKTTTAVAGVPERLLL